MFAMGGMNERAITHLDRLLAQNPADGWAAAMKSFLLLDRAGLLATRQRMADGQTAGVVDYMIDHFGESYFDICKWEPVGSAVCVPVGASANHRATAEQLAKAFGLPVTVQGLPAKGSSPAECIWLGIWPMGPGRGVPGYMIFHLGKKGTVITATDEQWLTEAVKRFIETSRQHDGKRQAPIGLSTSYELAR
jgi:hypothetical protein